METDRIGLAYLFFFFFLFYMGESGGRPGVRMHSRAGHLGASKAAFLIIFSINYNGKFHSSPLVMDSAQVTFGSKLQRHAYKRLPSLFP